MMRPPSSPLAVPDSSTPPSKSPSASSNPALVPNPLEGASNSSSQLSMFYNAKMRQDLAAYIAVRQYLSKMRTIMLSAMNGDPTAALQPAPDLLQPAITFQQQQQQQQQYQQQQLQYQNYLRSLQQHHYQMDLWRQHQQQQQQLATAATTAATTRQASESPKKDPNEVCGSSPLKRPAESSSSSSCGSDLINKRRRKRVRRRVSLDSEQSWEPGALRDKPFKGLPVYKEKIPCRSDPTRKTELVHKLDRVPTQEMFLEDYQEENESGNKEKRSGWFIVCPYCLETTATAGSCDSLRLSSCHDSGSNNSLVPYVSNRVNNVKRHIWKMHEAVRDKKGSSEQQRRMSFSDSVPMWHTISSMESFKEENKP